MNQIPQLHPIQIHILHQLLLNPTVRFRDLNTDKLPTDQFSFHLKRLVELDYIKKDNHNHYTLTFNGKDYADHIDTQTHQVEAQGKLTISVTCFYQGKYLVQQRLKHPYYGYWGNITGKIRFGETPLEAAHRELFEETGLSADLQLCGIKHKRDYEVSTNKLLADKYFFVFLGTTIHGDVISEFAEGKNSWLSEQEIFQLDHLFEDMKDIYEMLKNPQLEYKELSYQVSGY